MRRKGQPSSNSTPSGNNIRTQQKGIADQIYSGIAGPNKLCTAMGPLRALLHLEP